MKRKHMQKLVAVLAALGFACGPLAAGPAAAAPTRSVTAQAAYECRGEAAGAPSNTDTVSVQMQLAVPTSVAPGEAVSLRGVLKMQFSEQLRQKAQTLRYDTLDAYSTTISNYRTMAGSSSHYFADRWQSGPTPIRNPMEVSGPVSFPTFTVPSNATGAVKLQLMQNGATDNIVTEEPAKVAFNVYIRVSGPGGAIDARVSCFMPRANPAVIATIPVATGTPAADGSSKPGSAGAAPGSDTSTTQDGTGTGAAPEAAAPGGAPGAPGGPASAPAGGAPLVSGTGAPSAAVPGSSTGVVASGSPVLAPSAAPEAQGVYVSTGFLVLAGFALVLATLGYAVLTNIRIRNIRSAVDS